jgi:hypothetical protein
MSENKVVVSGKSGGGFRKIEGGFRKIGGDFLKKGGWFQEFSGVTSVRFMNQQPAAVV